MKKRNSLLISVLSIALLLSLLYGLTVIKSWHVETVDFVGSPYGGGSSITLDSKGYPHISYSYSEYFPMYNLRYASWTGSSWDIQTIEYGQVGSVSSIALDSNDNPHIAYPDNKLQILKYASRAGSIWTIQIVDYNCSSGYPSLVLDSNDVPHICYEGSDGLKYAYLNGSNWNIITVDKVDSSIGPCLRLDSKGSPHISYTSGVSLNDQRNWTLKYASLDGSKWIIQSVDSNVSLSQSMALDTNDTPHICYYQKTTNYGNIKYAKWTGGNWLIETIGLAGGSGSIAIDSNGIPQISYVAIIGKYAMSYAIQTGSSWNIKTIDEDQSLGGGLLVLDAHNLPHIITGQQFTYGHAEFGYAIAYVTLKSLVEVFPMLYLVVGLDIASLMAAVFLLNRTLRRTSRSDNHCFF